MAQQITDQDRAESFRRLWSRQMHWAYNDMAECVATWKQHGINSLVSATDGAIALLADDLRRNAAFHAMLNAEFQARQQAQTM